MPGVKRIFNKLWLQKPEYKEWLLQHEDKHKAKCSVCNKEIDVSNLGEMAVIDTWRKEPGILEEPNLTLLTTDLSCKIDSTVLQKGPLISVSSQESSDQEKNPIAESSEKECRTLISPQFLGSPETPSMISFLHHEQSCQQTGNDSVTVQLPVNKNSFPEVVQENTTPVSRDVKRSLFQKDRYKERTKRLWNNLEEVRKRNLAEERKKEIENNRRKAKEFAKKLTPKQRRK